ncbi:MAG TPA: hypothetical protein VGL02_19915, partial [Streptomyces sp.]
MSSQSTADIPVGDTAPVSATTGGPAPEGGAQKAEKASHRWWVLGVIALAQLMVVLDATIV